MRLVVIANDGESNPSTRLRILQYVPTLERQGFEVSTVFVKRGHSGRALGRELQKRLAQADVVFVQRVLTKELVRNLSRSGLPVIFDVDDAIHYIRQSQYPAAAKPASLWARAVNIYRAMTRGSKFYGGRKRLLDEMLSIADHVVVGNEWLFDELRLDSRSASIVPTAVWLEGVESRVHEPRAVTTLGWIGVKGNLSYLHELDGVFTALRRKYGDRLRLTVVSSEPFETVLPTTFESWSLETEADSVMRFDIGLMPLADDPFSRGKCAFKAVFCMSRGVPVVASPVGANVALIQHGINGWLAESADDWVEAISALTEEVSLRASMGRLARETIEEQYSADLVAKDLTGLLRRTTDSDRW